jgi:hypothetical protein
MVPAPHGPLSSPFTLARRARTIRTFGPQSLGDLVACLELLENQIPFAAGAVAAGSLQTPSFIGPGEVTTSVWIATKALAHPRLIVSLLSDAGRNPQEANSRYS